MEAVIEHVLAVARREIGVKEQGPNNCGPRVKEYLAAVGLPEGNPWCAAWVAWCFQRASVHRWPMTGDTWALETWGRQQKVLKVVAEPGDVFLVRGSNGRPIHTGLVSSVAGNRIGTIEGNTGGPSDTDGDGVYAKTRPMGACDFIRWIYSDVRWKPAEKVLKIFAHDGKRSVVIEGETHHVSALVINGEDAPSVQVVCLYS